MENYKHFVYVSPKYRLIEDNKNIQFDKAIIIGCFSMDGERNFKFGIDNLRYFKIPKKYPLDLNEGKEKYKPIPNSYFSETKSTMMKFLMEHNNGRMLNHAADIITYRGILMRIMSSPYYTGTKDIGWTVKVAKYKGKLYISHSRNSIQLKLQQKLDISENFQTLNMYTKKFEQFCFSDHPNEDPDSNVPLEEGQQFFCVYKQKFCGFNLLYAADVDGVISKVECDVKSLDAKKLIQTKIQAKGTAYDNYWRNMKLLRWWSQSVLVGIENIIVGNRDENGLIHEPPDICPVRSLPEICKDVWKPHVCLRFLSKFLFQVKQHMQDVDSPYIMYEYSFLPSQRKIGFRVLTDETTTPVLTENFLEFLG